MADEIEMESAGGGPAWLANAILVAGLALAVVFPIAFVMWINYLQR